MRSKAAHLRTALENDRGFSMIEIMVALVLFAVGIVALMQIQPQATRVTGRSQQISKATAFAQEEIERLSALEITHADLTAGAHDDPDNPLEGVFVRQWTVTDNKPMAGMKKVDVEVTFPTTSTDSLVSITTYVTRF
jgi:type IV pilus assembly protein PilV